MGPFSQSAHQSGEKRRAGPPSHATILIADYDTASRQASSERLLTLGFMIVYAGGGPEALAAALAIRPEVVAATIFLPDMSGIELCRRLKRDRRTADTTVILQSRTTLLAEQARQAHQAGCDVLLIRPDLPETLAREALRRLEGRASQSDRNHALRRICDIYLEEPGLHLTGKQIQRLIGAGDEICQHTLESLVRAEFLFSHDEVYVASRSLLDRCRTRSTSDHGEGTPSGVLD